MIDVSTIVPKRTSLLNGGRTLAGHVWPSMGLATRFDLLTQRLDDIETLMYTHDDPDEAAVLRAEPFDLPGISGKRVSLQRLLAFGKPVVLLFTDPAGETGRSLMSTVSAWQQLNGSPITFVAVAPGAGSKIEPPPLPHGVTDILFQDDERRVAADYGVVLTPAALLIRPNGAIAGKPVVGQRGIESMLSSIATAAAEAAELRQQRVESNAPTPGMKAPHVILPDLDDIDQPIIVDGTPQVILFWSPDCGYCDQLLPEMRVLEASRPAGSPPITLVARGTAEANRAQGFGFRTLLDHDLSGSTAFGAFGTPAAVITDASGTVMSPVASGIRDVRELLCLNDSTTFQLSHHNR